MWGMEKPTSDLDINEVYIMDSRDFLLQQTRRNREYKGKETYNGVERESDVQSCDLGNCVREVLKGNVNYLWAVTSPIVVNEYRSVLRELREIAIKTIAKNCFHSINGMAEHNIYHFITGTGSRTGKVRKGEKAPTREIDRNSLIYKKKLNTIGRSLKFGINVFVWGKPMFEKVEITKEEELWDLKNKLNEAYTHTFLPEKPDPVPFEKFLIKWRLKKMGMDDIINGGEEE